MSDKIYVCDNCISELCQKVKDIFKKSKGHCQICGSKAMNCCSDEDIDRYLNRPERILDDLENNGFKRN